MHWNSSNGIQMVGTRFPMKPVISASLACSPILFETGWNFPYKYLEKRFCDEKLCSDATGAYVVRRYVSDGGHYTTNWLTWNQIYKPFGQHCLALCAGQDASVTAFKRRAFRASHKESCFAYQTFSYFARLQYIYNKEDLN